MCIGVLCNNCPVYEGLSYPKQLNLLSMATHNPELIEALRETACRLEAGARYEWGHMGRCNCGHLVQSLTDLSDVEIVASIDFKVSEWSEHANDYCEGTSRKVDDLFEILEQTGFTREDVIHLEYLSDQEVLRKLEGDKRHLRRNKVEDVSLYMNTLADMLEEELVLA